jgi:hypothetical protein
MNSLFRVKEDGLVVTFGHSTTGDAALHSLQDHVGAVFRMRYHPTLHDSARYGIDDATVRVRSNLFQPLHPSAIGITFGGLSWLHDASGDWVMGSIVASYGARWTIKISVCDHIDCLAAVIGSETV